MDYNTTIALETFAENIIKSPNLTRVTRAHELLGALGMLYQLDLIDDEEYMRMSKACIKNIKHS